MGSSACSVLILLSFLFCSVSMAVAGNFFHDFELTWGGPRAKILNNGQLLTLSLDRDSGSGFQSRYEYLYSKIEMQLKLVPGNSAGTVTTYYLKSEGYAWDEIDFEFLGNLTGDPYTVHTNVFTQGKGNREQQFRLWFDPTTDFHTYSILWNPQNIIFYVDGAPIRQFKNLESKGVPYLKSQPMRLHSTLWNADDWATRGGLVKTDWAKAPFVASYRNFIQNACFYMRGASSCNGPAGRPWMTEALDPATLAKMRWIQRNYMVYNYCTDYRRFPQGFPPECTINV